MKITQRKLRGKAALSAVLAFGMTASMFSVGSVPAAAETEENTKQMAQDTIQGSAVLHCFDWSYNTIKANMADIAAAGYTAVQTSPVQPPKDYGSTWTDAPNQWWKLYQPLDLSVSDGDTWLGTKAELQALCEEADKYNIKVIVDIVSNHLANDGTDGGTYARVNSNIANDMKNSDYFHSESRSVSDSSRRLVTMGHLGMPDLNTGNPYVQQKALVMLQECVSLGVDGFRFDAAKHIETPEDETGVASSYWSTVVNGIKADNPDVFIYGEILGLGGVPDIKHYTKYMAVTDNITGDRMLNNVYTGNIAGLKNSYYEKGTTAAQSVLWVESHDTYMGDSGSSGNADLRNTKKANDEQITRTWAIVGSRADSTSLFFARPSEIMGEAGADTTWKSNVVTEVNKFKNYFNGKTEYLSYDQTANVAYNERGTAGVVIVTSGGSQDVSITAKKMKDGTYKDQITGGTFTVSGGMISGTVGSSGVAVVYNAEESIEEEESTFEYSLFGWINGAHYASEGDASNLGEYRFKNGWLKVNFDEDSYIDVKTVSESDNANLDWFMTKSYDQNATKVTLYNTADFSSTEKREKMFIPGNTDCYLHITDNGDGTLTLERFDEMPKPTITGREASLDDDINMGYVVDLGMEDAQTAQMTFEWASGSETVDLKDAETTSDGRFKALCSVPAKEMADEITMNLVVNGEVADTRTDSVKTYLNNIIDISGNDIAVTLAKSMLTYGAEAQKLFGYNTNNLANAGFTGYEPEDINVEELASFNTTNSDFTAHGLGLQAASLRLESTTMMRLYFVKAEPAPNEFPALTDGKAEYAAHDEGGEVYYDIPGFEAGSLRKDRNLKFTDSAEGAGFTVNVDAYTKAALASTEPEDEQLKTTLKALYAYNTAAKAYQDQ